MYGTVKKCVSARTYLLCVQHAINYRVRIIKCVGTGKRQTVQIIIQRTINNTLYYYSMNCNAIHSIVRHCIKTNNPV